MWEEETEPEQPFALRRSRRSGVRIWLRRPWFSSGDGELLAVVLGSSLEVPAAVSSRRAKDPIQDPAAPANILIPPLVKPAELLLNTAAGRVVDPRPGRPVTQVISKELVDFPKVPNVFILGYQPEYHWERGQWFVGVALDPDVSLWPFMQLAVARYQPHSLKGFELSPVVLTDWVQPLPQVSRQSLAGLPTPRG